MKLEVGDVRLDMKSGVSFAEATERPDESPDVDADPLGRRLLVAMSAAGFLLFAAFFAAAFALQFWPLAFPTLLFTGLGVGAAVLAATSGKATVTSSDATTVLQLLRRCGARDADALTARLGWDERRLLETIVELVEAGDVEEDLDIETGHWFYTPADAVDDEQRTSFTALDRLKAIETENEGVVVEK